VSINIAAIDRIPAATGKAVTVGFTTQSALVSGQTVTVSFPSSFLTGTIAVTFAGAVNTFATTTTAVGTNKLTIAVGSAGAAATAYTITLTGATMPGPQPASTDVAGCETRFGVETTTDMIGGANTPQIGGVVTGVTFSVAADARVPATTSKTVTISFTTRTALTSGNLVTIDFPASYISGAIGVTFAGAVNTFATTTTAVGTSRLTIAVGSAGAAAAAYTITLTGATMGPPIAANPLTGISVGTTTDLPSESGFPALGGAVTAAALNIATADRIPSVNRKVIVTFTLATALVAGNTVTVQLPAGLVFAVTAGAATGILANAALVGNNIVLTASGAVTAAAQRVTICGVQLQSFTTSSTFGVRVMTTMDYTTTCSATGTVGTVQGQVTAVSMNIPLFASRVAANTAQSVTFAFTTATQLPTSSSSCNSVNSVTITFPTNFFVTNTVGSCSAATMLQISGLTGYTLTGAGSGPSSTTQFIFTGTVALPAASYTVVIGGLKLGSATSGDDLGIKVQTSLDAISIGAPSGPISGYKVTSVTMPSSCQASSSCQNVVIGFSSTAGSILKDGTLDITFSNAPVAGTVQAFMSGDALITGAFSSPSTLRLTVNRGTWVIGSTATVTLTGMTVVSTGLQTVPQYVSIGGSTNAYSMTYMPTGAGTTTTTSLTIVRPFPGVTNTIITIAFSTTNGIANNDIVRVFYPTGFFIDTPQFATCEGGDQYTVRATGLGSCSTVGSISTNNVLTAALQFMDFTYYGGGRAAGSQTIVVSGMTLSTTAVAASTTFSVVTTQNSCSAGMISTGSISSSNPGGSNAPASAGSSFVVSVAAAFACVLLYLL